MKAVKQEALLAIFKLIDADCGGSQSQSWNSSERSIVFWCGKFRGEVGHKFRQSWRLMALNQVWIIVVRKVRMCGQHGQRCEERNVGGILVKGVRPSEFAETAHECTILGGLCFRILLQLN